MPFTGAASVNPYCLRLAELPEANVVPILENAVPFAERNISQYTLFNSLVVDQFNAKSHSPGGSHPAQMYWPQVQKPVPVSPVVNCFPSLHPMKDLQWRPDWRSRYHRPTAGCNCSHYNSCCWCADRCDILFADTRTAKYSREVTDGKFV